MFFVPDMYNKINLVEIKLLKGKILVTKFYLKVYWRYYSKLTTVFCHV